MTEGTVLPRCMQCGSYTGKLNGKEFKCKSCGCTTDQPEEVWEKDDPSKEERADGRENPCAFTEEKGLMVLLEAYDTGSPPFNMKSEARDLYEHLDGIFDNRIAEELEAEEKILEEVHEEEANKHLAERKQALIEAVSDACAPHLTGLASDIVAMIEEYIE